MEYALIGFIHSGLVGLVSTFRFEIQIESI